MSRDAVDRLPCRGGPDDRVADGGRAGSGFAHLSSWRRGGALERSYERGDHEQRHDVRVLPGHSEHPRHDAVACLVQQAEDEYTVADKQPGAAEVLGVATGRRWCIWHHVGLFASWRSLAYRDGVPYGIRERYPLRPGNYELRCDMAKSLTVGSRSPAERVWPVGHMQAGLDPLPCLKTLGREDEAAFAFDRHRSGRAFPLCGLCCSQGERGRSPDRGRRRSSNQRTDRRRSH